MTALVLLADYEGPQDFGEAMTTMLCIAGLAVVGSYTFTYIAHCFFAVAEATASGQDEVKWPDEPMTDRLGKAIWLGWALLLAGGPTFILGQAIAGPRVSTWLIGPVGIGLLFPLFMLSMQSGGSIFHVVQADAYRRLTRRPDHLIAYYASVAVSYAVIAIGCYLMFRLSWSYAPFGAGVAAIGILLAGRLYGRLCHLIDWVKLRKKDNFVESPGILIPPPKPVPEGKFTRGTEDAYGFKGPNRGEPETVTAHQPLKRIWVEEGADDPYALADGPAAVAPPRPELPESIRNPSREEMALAMRSRPIPPPKQPWTIGTFSFPFRQANYGPLLWLALGIAASSVFMRGITLGRQIG